MRVDGVLALALFGLVLAALAGLTCAAWATDVQRTFRELQQDGVRPRTAVAAVVLVALGILSLRAWLLLAVD